MGCIVRKTCFMATIFVNVCVSFLGAYGRTLDKWTNKLAGCSALVCSPAIYCNIYILFYQWKIIITSQYSPANTIDIDMVDFDG